jgi:hypothetical protein
VCYNSRRRVVSLYQKKKRRCLNSRRSKGVTVSEEEEGVFIVKEVKVS